MAEKKEELVKQQPAGSLVQFEVRDEMPVEYAGIKSTAGMEGVDRSKLKKPRICLAQQMSHELDPMKPVHIPGLAVGLFYNNLTQAI